jgi:hypothetical protein
MMANKCKTCDMAKAARNEILPSVEEDPVALTMCRGALYCYTGSLLSVYPVKEADGHALFIRCTEAGHGMIQLWEKK